MAKRFRVDDKYMVRRVPVSDLSVDMGDYEIVDRKTKRRDWIGDVYASKDTASRLCAVMNREYRDAVQEGRSQVYM